MRVSIDTRFWSKVAIGEPDACWEWQGGGPPGYGRFTVRCKGGGQKTFGAHRLAYMLVYGPIPEGFDVCHSCDNPPCVNPFHLRADTKSSNSKECYAKGRRQPPAPIHGNKGMYNGMARIPEEVVATIRESDEPYTVLAARHGVHYQTVYRIAKGLRRKCG